MNHHNDKASKPAVRGRGAGRWLLTAALAMAAGAITATASFAGDGMTGRHHSPRMAPAAFEKHVDDMVSRLVADGTEQQKAQVAAIATSLHTDMLPVHEQFRQAHARAHVLLMAPVIDRAALEELRAGQMRQADLASKRVMTALEDAAEVLTPAQRARFAGHLPRRMH